MRWPDELQFIPNSRLPQKTTTARMDGKRCVVTGATSGVGYHTARRLADGGAELVLVCRNAEKAAQVADELRSRSGCRVSIVIADLARLSDVRGAADSLVADGAPVHVLVNNAGVHSTRRILTEDGHELSFAVNHLASFLLTRLLIDRMVESAPARIIQVSSEGHRFGGLDLDDLSWSRRRYRGIKGYGASKVAQLLTVWELAARLQGSGVSINAVHPGAVRTNIGMNNGPAYRAYSTVVVNRFLKDPAIAGESLYYLAAAPEMAGTTGRFYNLTNEEVPSAVARDRELGRRVWDTSEVLVGLRRGRA